MTGWGRAQLVLAAAAVVAVALAPVVLAYLQLGYHPDVESGADRADPAANAERFLERAVHEAGAAVTGEHGWHQRRRAVQAARDRLDPRLETLASSRVAGGTAYRVTYNGSAARAWADRRCPGGRGRAFGPCEARRGVVVQERAGETHVLAVAFDVRVVTERGRTDLTRVVRTVGGA